MKLNFTFDCNFFATFAIFILANIHLIQERSSSAGVEYGMANELKLTAIQQLLRREYSEFSFINLTESRIGVLNHTAFAIFFHRMISFNRDLTILNIEMLQTAAIVRDKLDAMVRDHITIF